VLPQPRYWISVCRECSLGCGWLVGRVFVGRRAQLVAGRVGLIDARNQSRNGQLCGVGSGLGCKAKSLFACGVSVLSRSGGVGVVDRIGGGNGLRAAHTLRPC
jgi:hypothetical protein